jgi:hypothetical protein
MFQKNVPVRLLGPGLLMQYLALKLVSRSLTGTFLSTLYRVYQKNVPQTMAVFSFINFPRDIFYTPCQCSPLALLTGQPARNYLSFSALPKNQPTGQIKELGHGFSTIHPGRIWC